MSAFDTQSLSSNQILELARLAAAAYSDTSPPSGWSIVTGATLGGAFSGATFNNNGASAEVYRKGDTLTVSFRGTDENVDFLSYPSLIAGSNSYLDKFDALLDAVAAYAGNAANGISKLQVTGHSLGGAAANILRNVANSDYGGAFANAKFVTFASPTVSSNFNILNVGFENDWVFKSVPHFLSIGPVEFPSTTDHIVWFNDLLWANNDLGLGIRNLPEIVVNAQSSPHSVANYIDAVDRITSSEFYGDTTRDMTILVAATDLPIAPLGPSSSNATGPVFIVGRDANDILSGADQNDFIDARGGNDFIEGKGGNDKISAGTGIDAVNGGAGNDTINGGEGRDAALYYDSVAGITADLSQTGTNVSGGAGNDQLISIEDIVGTDRTDELIGDDGDNLLVGVHGLDTLVGNGGNDALMAGRGHGVHLDGGAGDDILEATESFRSTMTGGSGEDIFVFRDFNTQIDTPFHVIKDFNSAEDTLVIDADPLTTSADINFTNSLAGLHVRVGELTVLLENMTPADVSSLDIVLT